MALTITPQELVDLNQYPLLRKAAHWGRIPLGDVAEVQNGFAFKSEFFSSDVGVPLIRIRDIESASTQNLYSGEYSDDYLVTCQDVLIGMDGDFRVSRWPGQSGLLNQRVCRIRRVKPEMNEQFMFLCLQPYLNAIHEHTHAVTVKHLSSKTIGALPLPLPPIEEQHRIVEKTEALFTELDKGVADLKTTQQQLKVYRQSVLKHAFEGKLTEQWRKANPDKVGNAEDLLQKIQQERQQRYQQQLSDWKQAVRDWEAGGIEGKKPSKPKLVKPVGELPIGVSADLPSVPATWFWHKVGLMSLGMEYGSSTKSSKIGDVPVVRMGNIQNHRLDWGDLVFTSDREEIAKYKLTVGDVLFNRTNSPELVGKTAIYRGEREAVFAGYLVRVNQIGSIVLSEYLNYFLNSWIAKQYGNAVKTDGVNQSNINATKLANYPFPYCSIAEQTQIIQELESRLSVVDQLEKTIEQSLQKSEALRQSILKKAFAGELVPQDPNEESAAELLKRIKAQKADVPKLSPTRKTNPKKAEPMKTMKEVLSELGDWKPASEIFLACGIADGAEVDVIEEAYSELKACLETKAVIVERRGDEDWFKARAA